MAVTADLAKLLDKDWQDESLTEVLAAPVGALSGASDADAAALQQAFTIKAVGDLGRNKYSRAAQAFTAGGQSAEREGEQQDATEPSGGAAAVRPDPFG
ncbi:MAG TPA: hypothetical protein VIT41_03090 [Microlunatus sp.]